MKKVFTILVLSVLALNAHSQIIITGFMPSPKRTSANIERNMEYIQLMATEEITFGTGANSYTVVICRNGSAKAEGWAYGAQVYSLALTSGHVQKGEYFYVGGEEKIIAGAVTVTGSTVKSTDVSSAKWIRVKDCTTGQGDVVGNTIGSTGDMIQGFGTGASNTNADGIAVFKGATVNASTVPIDAVFYGSAIGGALTSAGYGYKVPVQNDYYNSAQGLFGEGTNTFFFDPTGMTPAINGVDNGVFFKLEGVYNSETNTWPAPRTLKLIELYHNNAGTITWGTLADIEKNVTLPVSISSFTASQTQNGGIKLEWKTASEYNNARFDIYRAADGKEFELIGDKSGAGITNIETSYNFTDHNPLSGTNYYKLVQVDADGKSTAYEKIIAVKTGLNTNIVTVSSDEQSITIYYKAITDKKGDIEITDVLGHSLFKQTVSIESNSLKLPLALQKGIYVLTLKIGTENYTIKFIR